MKSVLILTAAFAALGLTACQQENDAGSGAGDTSADISQTSPAGANDVTQGEQPTGEVHTGSGDITEIEGDRVTISHGPVESIDWPAMTMAFQAESSGMLEGLNIGDPVEFQFQQASENFVLTSIGRAQR